MTFQSRRSLEEYSLDVDDGQNEGLLVGNLAGICFSCNAIPIRGTIRARIYGHPSRRSANDYRCSEHDCQCRGFIYGVFEKRSHTPISEGWLVWKIVRREGEISTALTQRREQNYTLRTCNCRPRTLPFTITFSIALLHRRGEARGLQTLVTIRETRNIHFFPISYLFRDTLWNFHVPKVSGL